MPEQVSPQHEVRDHKETKAIKDAEKKIDAFVNRIEKEMDKLEVEYKHGGRLYQKKIEWTIFQNIHAFTKVRLQVMKFSEVSTLEKVAR